MPPTGPDGPKHRRWARTSALAHSKAHRASARVSGVIALALLAAGGCDRGDGSALTNYPDPAVYEQDPEFAGEWLGEVAGVSGELDVGDLEPGKYFGNFKADDGSVNYVLLLEQTFVEQENGGRAPSNRLLFTWQDGRGGRGNGWLLINREDTAITGKFGYDEAVDGLGDWSFIRFDAG